MFWINIRNVGIPVTDKIDEFKNSFFPIKAKAEKMAQLMNETGIESIRFTLETKPIPREGEFKSGGDVYKCVVWKEEKP